MSSAGHDSRSQDGPPLFEGVFFLLSGFDLPTQNQLSETLQQHGAVNVEEYDGSSTHVIVSRTFLWDDPVCAAARKDGKFLCTELWISDCLDLGVIQDVNHVIYKPVRDFGGIPGSKKLVVCLTGYQGQARRNVMRMVHLMGAHFSKPLVANRITHLVCYKFEGEKFNLAKQLGLKLVNHQWLEDCLRTWALLSEQDYSRSGFDVELSEAEAKDSEDEDVLKCTPMVPKVSNGALTACLDDATGEVKLDVQIAKGDARVYIQEEQNRSADFLSPKKMTDVGAGGELKVSTKDTEVERREAEPDSPFEFNSKRIKVTELSEMASIFERQNNVETVNDNGMIVEVMGQHGNGGQSAKKPGDDMPLARPDSGSPHKNNNILKLTTPGKEKASSATMKLVPNKKDEIIAFHPNACNLDQQSNGEHSAVKPGYDMPSRGSDLGSHHKTNKVLKLTTPAKERASSAKKKSGIGKKDEHMTFSPNACNLLASEQQNTLSAITSTETPRVTFSKDHRISLEIGLDSVCSNMKDVRDDFPREGTELQATPGTCMVQRSHTGLPPVSTLSNEHKGVLQVNCISTAAKRPPKDISGRNSKLKAAQKTLSMECTTEHLQGEAAVINDRFKDSLAESSIEKPQDDVNQGGEKGKAGEEQDMHCNNVNNNLGTKEARHKGKPGQTSQAGAKPMASNKQGKLRKKPDTRSLEKSLPSTGKAISGKENSSQLEVVEKKRTLNKDILLEVPREEADKLKKLSNGSTTSNDNSGDANVKDFEILKDDKCNVATDSQGKPDQRRRSKVDSKEGGLEKQAKLSKKTKQISTQKKKILSGEMGVPDKENTVIRQRHGARSEPGVPHAAVVVKNLHEKVLSPENLSGNAKTTTNHRCFALSGRREEIKPLQALLKKLGGKVCRDSHQWSHQTTHLVIVGQLRRTEKLFAAAAAGRWILREDYLKDSAEAGVLLDEKKYEWHGQGMTQDGSISFEAPRKWRELREDTGCCALEGLRILLYGECIIPSLDTLRRAIRAGGADLVATCPPYNKFLTSKVDFAIVNPGTPKTDHWIQQFLSHSVACVTTDFFVDFVCKPFSCRDRHVLYDTHQLVEVLVTRLEANSSGAKSGKTYAGEVSGGEDINCTACGRSDREDVMLLCGDDNGSGCGTAMHIDCCKPPLHEIPAHDWYCVQCTKPPSPLRKRVKKSTSRSKAR